MSKAAEFVERLAAAKKAMEKAREDMNRERPQFEVAGFCASVTDSGHFTVEGALSPAQIPDFLRWVEDTFGPFPETAGQKGDGDAD